MANIVPKSPLFGKIARFDPFPNIDEWFKDFGLRPFSAEMESAPVIKVDVSENDTAYTVRAEIPGVKKEDVKVQVDGNRVSISAETKQEKEEKKDEKVICRECYQGASYRSFSLASEIDESKAEAKYENGILELKLPKKTGKTSKHLEIK
ncbi:Hsp20/alpha crystallin family protein [Candidatus Nitrotoga fabula]|uniref:Small heat shock protein n=1 Tax=Candidatus Nitrotoga fabula TaxID=2182327 RepID=A0A2X0SDD7_9PROT|nr:Hsp20/alpha crystallin family protein [Candidatus Nitrotoga fabula]CAE6718480.1 Small heat shock protein [Candidatus Nitrotoga fabula]SPS05401.1 Small heat shock protein [Candidatus Nitrotoga fabula]